MQRLCLNDTDGTKLLRLHALEAHVDGIVDSVNLVYYPPGFSMPKHGHEHAQLSIVLAGQACEDDQLGSRRIDPNIVNIKSQGYQHENRFGHHGATFLSVNINAETHALRDEYGALNTQQSATAKAKPLAQFLISTLLNTTSNGEQALNTQTLDHDIEWAVLDLIHLVNTPRTHSGPPPRWLQHACEAVIETPWSCYQIANELGVHRVHLSRMFKRYYGCTLSHYRQLAKVQHSVGLLLSASQRNITQLDHQFSDHSHLNRLFHHQFGTTAARFRHAFSAPHQH